VPSVTGLTAEGASPVPVLLTLLDNDLRLDEKLAASLLALTVAALVHAFSYTAAEGAHPSKRWIFRRAADAVGVLALYLLLRLWV